MIGCHYGSLAWCNIANTLVERMRMTILTFSRSSSKTLLNAEIAEHFEVMGIDDYASRPPRANYSGPHAVFDLEEAERLRSLQESFYLWSVRAQQVEKAVTDRVRIIIAPCKDNLNNTAPVSQ